MKDMLAALNEMLERRERGEDPRFEEFMEQFGDFFPENPQNLDELLEQIARRMAAMQAMLNSMTPEQRAQLQQLSDQLLGDMDLRWQMDQLGGNLRSCSRRWAGTSRTTSRARTRWASARRCRRCRTSATSTSSSTCCAARPTPARWPRPTWTASATCSATTPPARSSGSPSSPRCSSEAGPHRATRRAASS